MQKTDAEGAGELTDLNLMRFLDALIRTQSVTRSGEHLGLSQPAASRTMSKLRATLNDPLLVRTSQGYVLTPLAQSLAIAVSKALAAASDVFSSAKFDPATSTRTYRMATTDYGAHVVFPEIAPALESISPNIHLLISAWKSDTLNDLETGAIDLALYADDQIPGDFHFIDIFRETYVLIVKSGHPITNQSFDSLSYFLSVVSKYKHVVARYPNSHIDSGDDVLARLGAKMSNPRISLPYFGVAPMIVAESNLIMAVPSRLAKHYANASYGQVETIPIPTNTEDFAYRLIWHERAHRDPGVQWLKNHIKQAFSSR
ncbi:MULTISPECIES: LysR family transcriptional regulator [Enterobacterales]|nr:MULTISPECIES: LysR family transcriptional regulator [Serratia]MBJ2097850.1 LysR family transcriptional regulator [Serratia ureilytica]